MVRGLASMDKIRDLDLVTTNALKFFWQIILKQKELHSLAIITNGGFCGTLLV